MVEATAVGVPESTQAELRASPVGSVGELEQPVIAPPLAVGVCEAMAESLVNVNGEPL